MNSLGKSLSEKCIALLILCNCNHNRDISFNVLLVKLDLIFIKWQNIFLAVLYYGTVVIVGVAVGLQTHNGFHAITFVLRHPP